MEREDATVKEDVIQGMIYIIRGQKVMLDSDLAGLYGVTTARFNQQVRRNLRRFPEDFMFKLTKEEFENLISQNVISRWGGRRKMPLVFTEQGVAMLSSVLRSDRAIQVNIDIMRMFARLRTMVTLHGDLKEKVDQMEKQFDKQFKIVFSALKQLLDDDAKPKRQIGFKACEKGGD